MVECRLIGPNEQEDNFDWLPLWQVQSSGQVFVNKGLRQDPRLK